MLSFLEMPILLCLIFLLLFYPCKWAANRFVKNERHRKIASWLVPAVLTPIIYLGLIWLMLIWFSHIPSRDFDRTSWFSDKFERHEMVGDLLEKGLLVGKDSTQLKEFLGDPWIRRKTGEWTYDMGNGIVGFGVRFHHLKIHFEENRVLTVEHVTWDD